MAFLPCYNNATAPIYQGQVMSRKTAKDFFDGEETAPADKNIVKTEEKDGLEEKRMNTNLVQSEVKDNLSDDNNEKEDLINSTDEKTPIDTTTFSNTTTATSSSNNNISYEQYVHQYQQYYAQYYSQYMMIPAQKSADPAYELFTGTLTPSTTNSSIPAAMSFDAGRANRQMTAYFDPTKFQSVLSPEMQAAQRTQKQQQQARLTAKEIEAFKKKKIEKKKSKNRWFYE